ncbi:potassium channel protein [Microcoleus sp. LEGE 07076]|uniref:NAD-binding protein n=1 Tax=Microcoleus sp. LEGE 07076 TaxID=915322 RepID=UPI00187E8570|nr:potassium channel protein [Microcoleus sp. LEGE 07076]
MYSILEQKYQHLEKELRGGAIALGGILCTGTLWYWQIEKWSLLDAAYMTVFTLATVGYGEIHPLGRRGRMFTMCLILMGVMVIGYIVNRFTEALIQGYFQEGARIRQQHRLVDSLVGHYILCGFGRTGRQIALEFEAENIPFVVVDSAVQSIEAALALGYTAVQGDATLDETLLNVGIDRAICIVAALPSDAENLYTVMSAKTLNPKVRAIARATTEEAVKKLQRGGADAVVSPYITGGKRMAAAALRPQVMDFVDGILTGTDRSFYMEEFLVDPNSCVYVGQTLRNAKLRSQSGALVLAIRQREGNLIVGPTGETAIEGGDRLICLGTAEQLRALNQILSPLSFRVPRPRK